MGRSEFALDDAAFQAALRRRVSGWAHQGQNLLDEVGKVILEDAKRRAPVDTGELRDSGRSVSGGDAEGPYVDIEFGTDHALAQEFGTSTVPAHPYFRPARARAKAEIRSRARRFF